jgi:hypothetical protein
MTVSLATAPRIIRAVDFISLFSTNDRTMS